MEHDQQDSNDVDLADVFPETLDEVATLLRVAHAEDPEEERRTCLSVGDDLSGKLLVAALTRRFDAIADVSELGDHGLWTYRALREISPNLKIHTARADIFDDEALAVVRANGGAPYEFGYLYKALHHLRRNQCRRTREKDHICGGLDCIGVFDHRVVFERLWRFAHTIIISEAHYIGEDADKETARGGMLGQAELLSMFRWLRAHATVTLFQPVQCSLDEITPRDLTGRLRQTEHLVISVTKRPHRGARRIRRASSSLPNATI